MVLYIVGAFILVNILGGITYFATRKPAAAEPAPAATTAQPAENGISNEMVRALRVAGLDALEHGDYQKAVATFTEAITKGGAGDLPELLRIAKDLEERKKERGPEGKIAAAVVEKPPEEPAEEEPEEVEEKDSGDSKSSRRSSRRSRPKPRPAPASTPAPEPSEPEPPAPGLILVTSTPSGLVVAVDGEEHDLTPARVTVPPGPHRVTISKGTQVLHTQTVEVSSNRVSTVDADLEEKLRPPPAPVVAAAEPATPPPPPPPPVKETPPPPVKATPPPKAEKAVDTGDLFIESPNVFGTVYVNDKAVGTPPVVAKGLPVGDVRIEVRVDGVVRKQKSAVVKKNQRVKVVLN